MAFDREAFIRDRSPIFFEMDESTFDSIGYIAERTTALKSEGKTAKQAVEIARGELEATEIEHRKEAALAKAALFADQQAKAQHFSDIHEAAEKVRAGSGD